MEIHQQRSYEYLSEKEQTILSLIVINERSFKEVAAIMDISPYKVKEIYFRAKKFFVMFSEHFAIYDTVFPKSISFSITFLKYANQVLLRKADLMGNPEFIDLSILKVRTKFWVDLIQILESVPINSNPHYAAALELLLEFDKWNERRILPKAFQRPSGFDRRRLKVFKKLKDTITGISDIGLQYIKNKFENPEGKVFIVIVNEKGAEIIPFVLNTSSFLYFTKNGLLIFDSKSRATELGTLIFTFSKMEGKTTHGAYRFWSEYRVLIFYAINIEEILKIKKEEFLEITEKDKAFLRKVRNKIKRAPKYTPSNPSTFW